MSHYAQHISLEPGKRGGKPCVRGLRISVQDVLDWLAAGRSAEEIIQNFPELMLDDIRAVLSYAAERERHAAWVPVAV